MPFDAKLLEGRPWLLEESQLRLAIARLEGFNSCYSAREVVKARRKMLDLASNISASSAVRPAAKGGMVAVVPVFGPIDQHLSSALMKVGGTSLEEVSASLDALDADPRISTIVLRIDSGGGGLYGLEETSDKIYDMRKRKKMYAIADSMAASAAFWLMSAAEVTVCTPGGDVGSVGCYCVHLDQSVAMERAGVKINLIKAGKYKAEGIMGSSLTQEAIDAAQAAVDETYSKFIRALARNRNTTTADVRANYGQGRVVGADKAIAAGMVDRVESFDSLISRLTGGTHKDEPRGQRGIGASTEVLRARRAFSKGQ